MSASDYGAILNWSSDGITLRGERLLDLVKTAYGEGREIRVIGGPSWIGKARFDIQAKAPPGLRPEEMFEPIRALLAERFGLKLHIESRTDSVLELVLARADGRLGPNLKPAAGCENPRPSAANTSRCSTSISPTGLILRSAPVSFFVMNLAIMNLSLLVVDRTGLTGEYDITLDFRVGPIDPNNDQGPSFFTAIKEQLGLELRSAKAPVNVYVIDAASEPTEN